MIDISVYVMYLYAFVIGFFSYLVIRITAMFFGRT